MVGRSIKWWPFRELSHWTFGVFVSLIAAVGLLSGVALVLDSSFGHTPGRSFTSSTGLDFPSGAGVIRFSSDYSSAPVESFSSEGYGVLAFSTDAATIQVG